MSVSSATTQLFTSRQTSSIVKNRLTPEGVGVSVLRSVGQNPRYFNPFALLDHFQLEENSLSRGIGFHPHPHRGISTLTYILPKANNGSVRHQDHQGRDGIIGPGDIQYMSAGRGIVHSEMPGDEKAVDGLQLWVNLLKKDKMSAPAYQEYKSAELPHVQQNGIDAKIIAGTAFGVEAKVKTKTPVHYIHYKMPAHTVLHHPLPPHWSTLVYTFGGSGYFGPRAVTTLAALLKDPKDSITTQELVKAKQTVFFEKGAGSEAAIKAETYSPDVVIDPSQGVTVAAGDDGFDFILISGAPLPEDEGVFQHGPVILTSRDELNDFFDDLQNDTNGFEGYSAFSRNWRSKQ